MILRDPLSIPGPRCRVCGLPIEPVPAWMRDRPQGAWQHHRHITMTDVSAAVGVHLAVPPCDCPCHEEPGDPAQDDCPECVAPGPRRGSFLVEPLLPGDLVQWDPEAFAPKETQP